MIPRDANHANERGRALSDASRYADAVPHYLDAVRLAPSWSDPWFNLGVAYKHTGDFAGSLRASERALAVDRAAAGEGALWNVGIAATALGQWEKARRAWSEFGITLPDGEGPIDMGGVLTPMRLNPRADAEVVWSLRIDPARARLRSIPLPSSRHRYDDLILHDGAANGYRKLAGQDVPVFDELCVLEASRHETWRAKIVAPSEPDLTDLERRLGAGGVPVEDWTGSVRLICDKCSTGVPHKHHGDELVAPWKTEREIAFAVRALDLRGTFEAWASAASGRSVVAHERLL